MGWFCFSNKYLLLGTRPRKRSAAGAESETVTESESESENENENVIETISGDTGPALDHVPGPGTGIRGSLDTGPEAEVRVPPEIGKTETSMGNGIWTDGGISMWTALPQKSLPSETFTMARLPASCSLDVLCSWRD